MTVYRRTESSCQGHSTGAQEIVERRLAGTGFAARALRGASVRFCSVQGRIFGRLLLRATGVRFGKDLVLLGMPIVSREQGSTIALGERVVLCSSSLGTALGVNHPVVLRTLRTNAEIVIGDDVGVSGGSICAAYSVHIGARTMLGANVMISDTDFHVVDSSNRRGSKIADAVCSRVHIGKNVFIGAAAIVLKGVQIGDNSVIGAGSVITRSIPNDVVAAGNPCRVIRKLASLQSQS